ncbi:MAG: CHAT domain-containing protein [Leptolyngbya sp. SIO1D8]|nr:CHAT domain-containing protein [Leptolyngbya sp. SIO1D8]
MNVLGRLQLGQGDAEAAFESWGQTVDAYQVAGDRAGQIRSQLRQARALQAMGFYRRAVDEILIPLGQQLTAEPPSAIKAQSLRSLAEALIVAESLDEARQAAQASLTVAETLALEEEIAATQLTLGNIEYAQAQEYQAQNSQSLALAAVEEALTWYNQVSNPGFAPELALDSTPDSPPTAVSANALRSQLNQLALLIEFERWDEAVQRWPSVYAQVNTLSPNQDGIYTRINLANSLEQLAQQPVAGAPSFSQVLAILETAQTQATALADARAEAHVLGYLGKTYQSKGQIETDPTQLEKATKLTEEALFSSETVNAVDISYLWYEQLGDLHVQLSELENTATHKQAAIAAYRGAVNALKFLRSDLVTMNPEVQFSFQQSIEPLHRKLVSLLLEGDSPPSQASLKDARAVLESLQLEELNNYLRAACLNSQEVSVDNISGDRQVAVIYPIVLPDKIGIIANLPSSQTKADQIKADSRQDSELQYYTAALASGELDRYAARMRRQMVSVDYGVLDTAEHLYNLLFPEPLLQDLANSQPDTLVFVPDGVLRNIPIAALFDGESYLVEQYSIAITPGLQLLNPQPLQETSLEALTFGLTEAVAEWSSLPYVADEIEAIGQQVPIESFLNEQFTDETFEKTLRNSSAPIIHLATHGQFSSRLDETFIQAWNNPISVNDLSRWLQSDRTKPVELLVLSACQTATGDQRAALGLAGMAIRAGARSTVASLWQVDDAATAVFMTEFYKALSTQSGNKAEALQRAQKHLIEDLDNNFAHPYYWAPFVLIGNWL